MKFVRRLTPATAMAALALTLGSVPALAADDETACSAATLKGAYGLHGSGTRPLPPTIQFEQHSTLARRVYDGKGSFKSYPIVSAGSITGITEGNGTFGTGTYEVNPDCTGKVSLNLGSHTINAKFVIVNRGLEIMEVPTDPKTVEFAILKRQ